MACRSINSENVIWNHVVFALHGVDVKLACLAKQRWHALIQTESWRQSPGHLLRVGASVNHKHVNVTDMSTHVEFLCVRHAIHCSCFLPTYEPDFCCSSRRVVKGRDQTSYTPSLSGDIWVSPTDIGCLHCISTLCKEHKYYLQCIAQLQIIVQQQEQIIVARLQIIV